MNTWQHYFHFSDEDIAKVIGDSPLHSEDVSVIESPPSECKLKWIRHWMRVSVNAQLFLDSLYCPVPDEYMAAVKVFALIHDCRFSNEKGSGKSHGHEAAAYYKENFSGRFSSYVEDQLVAAIDLHMDLAPNGLIGDMNIVACCLDGDRLDVRRFGGKPAPHRLFTGRAKDLAASADFREFDKHCRSVMTS